MLLGSQNLLQPPEIPGHLAICEYGLCSVGLDECLRGMKEMLTYQQPLSKTKSATRKGQAKSMTRKRQAKNTMRRQGPEKMLIGQGAMVGVNQTWVPSLKQNHCYAGP